MEKRTLGSNGPQVGAIGLGCMGMTWAYGSSGNDETESVRVIHRALDLGATLIDTSDVYGPFTNEELVGRALQGHRERAVLATKVGLVHDPQAWVRPHGTPDHVRSAVDESRKRLRVDVIDLYQLHRVDPNVPLEETWGAMADLVKAGKVRQLGLSEVSVDQIARAHAIHPVASVQSELSLWTRDHLLEVVPWCADHNIAFIAYSPLGRGFLTGRFQSRQDFDADDWRLTNPRFSDEALAANLRLVDTVKSVARRAGATPAQVALAWTLAQGDHVIPIPGTRKVSRLEENLGAASITFTTEDRAQLNGLTSAKGERYAAAAASAPR